MFMRSRASFLAPLMFVLLLLGLSSFAGRARTNDAYQAGFAAGQASVIAEEGTATEGVAPETAATNQAYYGPGHYGYHGFSFFGFFFKMIFFFFLFGFLFKMFGFWRWRRWHARHGDHHGPWNRGGRHRDAGPREKQPDDIDPSTYYV